MSRRISFSFRLAFLMIVSRPMMCRKHSDQLPATWASVACLISREMMHKLTGAHAG